MGYLVIGIVWCVVWGIVVKKVIENKGYQENWFWWGFFFGIFALIVALTKQSVTTTTPVVKSISHAEAQTIKESFTNGNSVDRVDIYSAVHIVSWDIQKINNAKLILSVEFFNVSESTISAVMFSAYGFNSFGDKVFVNECESFDVIGQDMSMKPGESGKIQMILPDTDIRKADIKVKKVCFSDGTIVENTKSKWIDTKQKPLPSTYLECVQRKNPQGRYYAMLEKDYWQCVCGFVNIGSYCKSCNMEKLTASEYTTDCMEDTYQKYLKDLEIEEKEKKERRAEAEKQKKASLKYGIIFGSLTIVATIGVLIFSYREKEKAYEEERIAISECIDKKQYDSAYCMMITSDNYDRLKDEYGETLWEEQERLDANFKYKSWTYAEQKEDMVYNESLARNGVCYYQIEETTGDERWNSIYAVVKSGEKYQLYGDSCFKDDYNYITIEGLGNDSWDDYDKRAIWSNGWLFIATSKQYSESQFAIKYDEEEQKVCEVDLLDGFETQYGGSVCIKMKDGNVLIASVPQYDIDTFDMDKPIRYFDVVKGTVKELSYDQVEKMYDGEVEENILTTSR